MTAPRWPARCCISSLGPALAARDFSVYCRKSGAGINGYRRCVTPVPVKVYRLQADIRALYSLALGLLTEIDRPRAQAPRISRTNPVGTGAFKSTLVSGRRYPSIS